MGRSVVQGKTWGSQTWFQPLITLIQLCELGNRVKAMDGVLVTLQQAQNMGHRKCSGCAPSSRFPLTAHLNWSSLGGGAEGGRELPSITFQVVH